MAESRQKTLERVRKPRVHIVYDVEVGDATVKKELPFVVGVLGDFSGDPTEPLKPLRDRKFTAIDRDNFDDILAKMTPGVKLKVENTLQGDGTEMSVDLKFKSMKDFEPARIIEQVEPLRKLMEARNRLKDVQAQAERDANVEDTLNEVLRQTQANKAATPANGEGGDA